MPYHSERDFLTEPARKIREAREASGMSQSELATALSIHKGSWQHIEKGKKKIKPELLIKFCKLTGSDPESICLPDEIPLIRSLQNRETGQQK